MTIDLLLYNSHFANNPTATALILGAIGAICSLFGAILYSQHKKLIKKGIHVEGTVISIKSERSNKDSVVINYAIIRYQTLQNEPITKEHNIGISSNYSYKEGDSVEVIYDPDDNLLFTLNDASSKNTPLTFILLGLTLLAASIIIFIVKA